ncbi:hypothetical protein PVK06_036352 [Gossypium arboreum]|uniref:Reverse transcriptase n=1 Tax=Gossypium arboreum TaxID=29729 RepID=A0ABR0NJA8_GOSAR|nr:hypothetical protein PVK06_036352 [Gossypium arboreum]
MVVKFDMSKAYDRVEWKFMEMTMKRMGFDPGWVDSIVKYDCILLVEATERGAHSLKHILNEYEKCSGQCVNYDKSTVFFSTNTQDRKRIAVSNVFEVRRSTDLERYLGLPNLKGHDKKDIHWCTWKELCSLKEDGGLGFRNLATCNVALLEKKGWHFINFPNSLLARVLKEKYYLNLDFYNARLGTLPSLTWKSVWATRGLLEKGICWRFGKGNHIFVWDNLWISEDEADKLQNQENNENIKKTMQIPLTETAYEDFQVWRGELSESHAGLQVVKLGIFMALNKMEISRDRFHFIPKTKNTYANVLAKEALKRRESCYLVGGIPEHVRQALEKYWPKNQD